MLNELKNNEIAIVKNIKTGEQTRAYKSYLVWFPSGQKLCYLIWSHSQNRCVTAKAEHYEIVKRMARA